MQPDSRQHTFHSWLTALMICLMTMCLTGCGQQQPSKPVITVSIQPQKYILEQIAGDKIDVRCLLSNGGNPESYEPSFTHMVNLEYSSAYFRIGNIGFESAIMDRIKANHPQLRIYDNSTGIALITGTHTHSHDTDTAAAEPDPHTWSSIRNGKIIAGNMLTALCEIDRANSGYYRTRYDAFIQRLDSIDAAISASLAPYQGSAFAIWHPSLSYFARDYGLEQISLYTENKELSIADLKSRIDDAGHHDAHVFFTQKEFDTRQAQTVAQETDMRIVPINPMNYDWEHELTATAQAIACE